jgi:hypothetical protein
MRQTRLLVPSLALTVLCVAAPRTAAAQQMQAAPMSHPDIRAELGLPKRKHADWAERDEAKELSAQPKELLRGIKLTHEQKQQRNAIVKRTNEAREAIEREQHDAQKAGRPTAHFALQVRALQEPERAELRAILDAEQMGQFDRNVFRMGLESLEQ